MVTFYSLEWGLIYDWIDDAWVEYDGLAFVNGDMGEYVERVDLDYTIVYKVLATNLIGADISNITEAGVLQFVGVPDLYKPEDPMEAFIVMFILMGIACLMDGLIEAPSTRITEVSVTNIGVYIKCECD